MGLAASAGREYGVAGRTAFPDGPHPRNWLGRVGDGSPRSRQMSKYVNSYDRPVDVETRRKSMAARIAAKAAGEFQNPNRRDKA